MTTAEILGTKGVVGVTMEKIGKVNGAKVVDALVASFIKEGYAGRRKANSKCMVCGKPTGDSPYWCTTHKAGFRRITAFAYHHAGQKGQDAKNWAWDKLNDALPSEVRLAASPKKVGRPKGSKNVSKDEDVTPDSKAQKLAITLRKAGFDADEVLRAIKSL